MPIDNSNNLLLPQNLGAKILARSPKFIITGVSGWLGRALLEILYSCFQEKLSQNVIAISNSQPIITLRNGYQITTQSYDYDFEKDSLGGQEYFLCHFAFLTKDKIAMMSGDEYKKQNHVIRDNVTKIIHKAKPTSILYSSSGAIYGQGDLYGVLKLEDEIYFQKLAEEVGAQIIIPRIFNIAGPYINKYNLYALSNFIGQLVNDKKIIINANFPVVRSYVHILDLFKMCFYWLFDDQKKEKLIIFDTGNSQEIELFDLAKMIIELIDTQGEVIKKEYKDLPANYYVGNIEIEEILCKKYDVSLADYKKIILDTYQYLRDINKFDAK
jgi:nucleoside-diphosphate-sugar epimerase